MQATNEMNFADLVEEDLVMSSDEASEASDFDEDLDPDNIEIPGKIYFSVMKLKICS